MLLGFLFILFYIIIKEINKVIQMSSGFSLMNYFTQFLKKKKKKKTWFRCFRGSCLYYSTYLLNRLLMWFKCFWGSHLRIILHNSNKKNLIQMLSGFSYMNYFIKLFKKTLNVIQMLSGFFPLDVADSRDWRYRRLQVNLVKNNCWLNTYLNDFLICRSSMVGHIDVLIRTFLERAFLERALMPFACIVTFEPRNIAFLCNCSCCC